MSYSVNKKESTERLSLVEPPLEHGPLEQLALCVGALDKAPLDHGTVGHRSTRTRVPIAREDRS